MKKPSNKVLSGKKYSVFIKKHRRQLFIVCFAVIGIITLLVSQAATFSTSVEPELGDNGGSAASPIQDGTASGGQAIKFGAVSSGPTGWPSSTANKVCGNPAILDGPTTAPNGAITITPSTNLAAATAAAPEGSIFYLTKGTHTLLTGPVQAKANNKYIGAPGAIIDGKYTNNIVKTIRGVSTNVSMSFIGNPSGANDKVTIQYLTIQNFGQLDGKLAGLVNGSSINWSQRPGWVIANNTISNNGGAGTNVTSDGKLQNNCLENNEQFGFAIQSNPPNFTVNAVIEGNEIRGNNRSTKIEEAGVCTGCSGGLKIWNSKNIIIRNNNVSNNNGAGIWVDNNNIDTLVEGNVVRDNTKRGIFLEISYSAIVQKNYISGNYVAEGPGRGNFPEAGIYISEAGGDEGNKAKLGGVFPATIDVNNNYIVDNWNGINIWEKADRYCTRPEKNDTGNCPSVITDINTQCVINLTANADICRWKSENIKVHDNKFEITAAARASWCPISNSNCARNALHASTNGTGPYTGTSVQTAISKNQGNLFYNNTYIGEWKFSVPDQSIKIDKNTWQTTWKQDTDSKFLPN